MSTWTAVSDRLPDDGEDVLVVWSEAFPMEVCYFDRERAARPDVVSGWSNSFTHDDIDNAPTHWMRLPDGPQL
jgi:hypothetical protein